MCCEMPREHPLALRGEAVFGFRDARRELLLAGDVARALELAGVHAQVAVAGVQELLELREAHARVHAERAHDAEAHALVDEPIRVAGLGVGEIAGHRAQALLRGLRRGRVLCSS